MVRIAHVLTEGVVYMFPESVQAAFRLASGISYFLRAHGFFRVIKFPIYGISQLW